MREYLLAIQTVASYGEVLHRFEGLSYREISEVLSTSVDAVDALLRRAKADLREALIPWA